MEFLLDDEHVGLAETIDGLATRLDAVAANRAWADANTAPGLKLWSSLAELGIWNFNFRLFSRLTVAMAWGAVPGEGCVLDGF